MGTRPETSMNGWSQRELVISHIREPTETGPNALGIELNEENERANNVSPLDSIPSPSSSSPESGLSDGCSSGLLPALPTLAPT